MRDDIVITVWPVTLSDNSKVFNVEIGGKVLPAIFEDDANKLADKIFAAISDHTVASVGVCYAAR